MKTSNQSQLYQMYQMSREMKLRYNNRLSQAATSPPHFVTQSAVLDDTALHQIASIPAGRRLLEGGDVVLGN